ncbi:MAG: hypothetical protein K5931_04605, partial [Lachnospiraceae bacterium]|nr:hypothetical protein [Lachnospiraceae bacterium]
SFAKENDRRINVAIVPNSFEILKEKVPRGLPLVDEKKEIDKFYKDLEAFENVKTVDLYPKLLETSGEGKQVYYRTDHHWTTAAAYEGYKVICREMGIAPSSFETVKKGSIRDFYGTYYAKYKGIFIKADTIEYYDIPVDSYLINEKDSFDSLYDEDKAKIYDKYAFFLRGNYGLAVIKGKGQKRGRDLIVIKDSYGNCLIPFLTMDYDSITVLDLRYYGGSVKKLLDEKKDQDILLLYNFAHLNEDNNFYKLIK